MEKQENKKNASQRLDNVEVVLTQSSQTMEMMARDLMTLKEAIKLLGNKVDAMAKALDLSDTTISKGMIENNVEELKQKTAALIAQGILAESDLVEDDSFIIGQEISDDGSVANPRIQFALSALNADLKQKIKGSKTGDLVVLEEGKLKLLVTEVYKIQSPKLTQDDTVPQTDAKQVTAEVVESPAT